ncbi:MULTISPECIES: ABC transporter permease [unclassified Streptomyces]|uniref:ABC transporter permease n=1 Tax=unclassified Streptomyces TaxID=2593676 RepID=UPI003D8A7B88
MMTTIGRRTRSVLAEAWLPAVLLLLWWALSTNSTSLYFPPLSDIVHQLYDVVTTRFGSDILPSLRNFALGLAIAMAAGIALGLLCGLIEALHRAFQPLLEFLRAIPGVAILPVALFMFGIGTSMKVAVIAFGAFWPILLNTVDGVRGVDTLIKDVARSYHLRRRERLFRVVLPAASPQILAGVRISVSLGVILIVASEYIASTEGIGYIELQSARQYQMSVMWAALLLLGIVGYAVNVAFRVVEARLLKWHRGLRGTLLEGNS